MGKKTEIVCNETRRNEQEKSREGGRNGGKEMER